MSFYANEQRGKELGVLDAHGNYVDYKEYSLAERISGTARFKGLVGEYEPIAKDIQAWVEGLVHKKGATGRVIRYQLKALRNVLEQVEFDLADEEIEVKHSQINKLLYGEPEEPLKA